jgi:hypothetical protein
MGKLLLATTLVTGLLACATPAVKPPALPPPGAAFSKFFRSLDTPRKLSAFNSMIEGLGGKMPVDASGVYILDRRTLKKRCGKYAGGCYSRRSRPLIYVGKKSADTLRSAQKNYRDPHLLEGSNILTTYVHEQGHHMDQEFSSTMKFLPFDELEAKLFTLLFLQELSKRNPDVSTSFFYDELGIILAGAGQTLNACGDFRTYAEMVERFRNNITRMENSEEKEKYTATAQHKLADAVFAILARSFDLDIRKLYDFVHNSSNAEVMGRVDSILSSIRKTGISRWIKEEIDHIRRLAAPGFSIAKGCSDPGIITYSCSLINPTEDAVLSEMADQLLREGETPWKVAARLNSDENQLEKVRALYQSARLIGSEIKRYPWTFRRYGRYIYGRNAEFFAILRGNHMIEIFHRKRDMKRMDLSFKWGKTLGGHHYPELLLLVQNRPTRLYSGRSVAFLHISMREDGFRPGTLTRPLIKWEVSNVAVPSSLEYSGRFKVTIGEYRQLKGIAEEIADMARRGVPRD